MTLSIWRYNHFILAISTSLFLLIASVTGCILALEPITHQSKGFNTENLKNLTLASTIQVLEQSFDEVFTLEVESPGFVKVEVLTEDFETKKYYVNPRNAEVLSEVPARPAIYKFATNLHRSLFLKSVGRVFVALISILLVIIALTGIALLAKRQGGFSKIASKVQKDSFIVSYHVIASRWFLFPILIIASTGIYLSAEKFNVLPEYQAAQITTLNSETENFSLETIKLSEVKKITFPFSNDPDEFLHIALKNQELFVAPSSGKLLGSKDYPITHFLSKFSFVIHTGEGSVLWSFILFFASASILFFMYSGFVMAIRRIKKGKQSYKNTTVREEAEFIVLVGSETGTTYQFASSFCSALHKTGKNVYLDDLNNYNQYPSATHLIVFTATYGKGEATSNAKNFESIFKSITPVSNLSYSVVGFGSLNYPDYCKYAITVDKLLQNHPNFNEAISLFKINEANTVSFLEWVRNWEKKYHIRLALTEESLTKKHISLKEFKVVKKTNINIDDTFILELKPKKFLKVNSGDLLAFYPEVGKQPRYYSVAIIKKNIVLSIKKHNLGKASNKLYELKEGDYFNAAIKSNPTFQYPSKKITGILIANGTGIAPFLGMIADAKKVPMHLFWGGRQKESFSIYEKYLNSNSSKTNSISIHTAYSKEKENEYVQDLIQNQKTLVLKTIRNNGCIMICGSLAMQHGVLQTLESFSPVSIEDLQRKGQLKMDCY